MISPLPREVQESLQELTGHYEIEGFLDRGANGYVFFAANRVSGQKVAIKFYAGAPGDARHDEPRLLAQVRSSNVLRILDARAISDEWAFFITPRCEGDLDDFINNRPSTHAAIDVALGICTGVSAIHAARMLHRDLKPGNVVLQDGIPFIADFGSVRALAAGNDTVTASKHSILYRPPESFANDTYSARGDLYQIGVLTYQLLGGNLPYDGEAYLSAKDVVELAKISDEVDRSIFIDGVIRRRAEAGSLLDLRTLPPWVNGASKAIIRRLIAVDPNDRFATLGEAAAALTRCRVGLMNWQPLGMGAKLVQADRTIELRPTGTAGQFDAFIVREGVVRRAPRVASASLAELVNRFST